jgi:hypothetical protein
MGNLAMKKDMAEFARKTGGVGRRTLKLRTNQFDFKRSGRLSKSVDLNVDFSSRIITATVSVGPVTDLKPGESPDYPWFVYRGTGLFGPNKKMITPKKKPKMKFRGDVLPFGKTTDGVFKGNFYSLSSTQGQEPQDYVSSSIKAMELYIEKHWEDLADDIKRKILVEGLSESTGRMSF